MDLSANKDAERLINWQAQHDTLTKLPNRTLLLERLTRVLVHRRNRSEPGALLSIDIDRFKMVNDSIGPKLGDRLLIEAAMRVAMAARESDTVARLGSDEFAVMLPDLSDYAEAERMARSHSERALRNRSGSTDTRSSLRRASASRCIRRTAPTPEA